MHIKRNHDLVLEYSPTINQAPITSKQLYANACASDEVTIQSWQKIWLEQTTANKNKYGEFSNYSVGKLFGSNDKRPCIIAGSGPSLLNNIEVLNKYKSNVPIVSCLHNFHFFTDHGIDVDYYVTLDAGEVTIEEISEGGKLSHAEYIEATKDKTLCAFIGTHPKLLESWKGKVIFYNAPIPDVKTTEEINKIEEFHHYVSNGGNVLGACLYIAKAILGSNPIGFIGADFCFSYDNKFHAWNSKYDGNLGGYLNAIDVFGNRVRTWHSYHNFKCWFDYIAINVPGLYINCSEGGTFGAYPDGNIKDVIQMPLIRFLEGYTIYEQLKPQFEDSKTKERLLLF